MFARIYLCAQLIEKEGLESLTLAELHEACVARGIIRNHSKPDKLFLANYRSKSDNPISREL
jgi:hypothetical protein